MIERDRKLHFAGLFLTLLALVGTAVALIGLGAYWLIVEDARSFALQSADERVERVFDKTTKSGMPGPTAEEAVIYFSLLDGRVAPPQLDVGGIQRFGVEPGEDPQRIYVLYPADGGEPIWSPFPVSAAIKPLGGKAYALDSVLLKGADGNTDRLQAANYVGSERVWPDSKARLLAFQRVEPIGPLHRRVAWLTVGTVLAMMLVSGAAVFISQKRFWKRVEDINGVCETIAQKGHLDMRVPAHDKDALGLIGRNINGMLDEIEERGRLIASQDRFLDHDYRVPIAEIAAACNNILEQAGPQDQASVQGLIRIREIARRMDRASQERLELFRFQRDNQSDKEEIDLHEVAEEAVDANFADAASRNVHIAVHGSKGLLINGSRSLVSRALGNLIRNAVQHSAAGEQVEVRVGRDGAAIVAEVRDYGSGMTAERIADTTGDSLRVRSTTGGEGLGLAMVRGVAKAHNGEFTLSNSSPGVSARLRFAGG